MLRQIICIVGRTGFGKTLLARVLSRAEQRVFGYLPQQDFEDVIYLDSEDEMLNLSDNNYYGPTKKFRHAIVDPSLLELWGSMYYLAADAVMILEEFSTLVTRGQLLPPWLHRAVFLGRHRRLSLIISAQRAASIPIDARSQITRFITFNQREEEDIKWLRDSNFFTREQVAKVPELWTGDCLDSRGGMFWPIHRIVQETLGINCPHVPDPSHLDG